MDLRKLRNRKIREESVVIITKFCSLDSVEIFPSYPNILLISRKIKKKTTIATLVINYDYEIYDHKRNGLIKFTSQQIQSCHK